MWSVWRDEEDRMWSLKETMEKGQMWKVGEKDFERRRDGEAI